MSPDIHSVRSTGILFLIGFMGSGKSWLSQRLSEQEGIPRYDLDEEIEREQGVSIGEYFRLHGEDAFRRTERDVLERLCERIQNSADPEALQTGRPFAVVSTGGGTPCFGDNMEWMNAKGTTVWIDTPMEILIARLKRGREHRPLIRELDDPSLEAFIEDLSLRRRPFYAKAQARWEGEGKETVDMNKILEHA